MKKYRYLKNSLLSIVVLMVTGIYNPSYAQHQTDLTKAIDQYVDNHPVVGLAVAVVKGDEIVYSHAYGKKDIAKNTPLELSDIFRIASVSKSFTVTSLMQFAEQKKLSLDDDISNLIGFKVRNPSFPDKAITLRMILSHTSSLSDKNGYFNLDVINPDVNPDYAKCYNDYEPGSRYEYCNLALNMAGTILEKVSGERFDHYVVDHILKPLNIYGGYNIDDLDPNRFAHIYEYDAAKRQFIPSPGAYASRAKEIANYKMGYSTPIFSPTGGMKISVEGLATYMMMHLNNGKLNGVRIISKKSESEMRKPQLKNDPHQYGLGLLTTEKLIPGEKLIGHTGDAYGLYSSIFFEPKKKFGFVVITNGAEGKDIDGFQYVLKEVNNLLYDIMIKK